MAGFTYSRADEHCGQLCKRSWMKMSHAKQNVFKQCSHFDAKLVSVIAARHAEHSNASSIGISSRGYSLNAGTGNKW